MKNNIYKALITLVFVLCITSISLAFTIYKEGNTDEWVTKGTKVYLSGTFSDIPAPGEGDDYLDTSTPIYQTSMLIFNDASGQDLGSIDTSYVWIAEQTGVLSGYIQLGSVSRDTLQIQIKRTGASATNTSTNYLYIDGVAPSGVSITTPSSGQTYKDTFLCIIDDSVGSNDDIVSVTLDIKPAGSSSWYRIPSDSFTPNPDTWITGSSSIDYELYTNYISDSSALGDSIYTFRFNISDTAGNKLESLVTNVDIDNASPAMEVTSLTLTRQSGGDIKVEWTYSPSSDEDFYRFKIYRDTGTFDTETEINAAHLLTNLSSYSPYTDQSTVDGETYQYFIVITDTAGNYYDTNTNALSDTVVADASNPTLLYAAFISPTQVKLQFSETVIKYGGVSNCTSALFSSADSHPSSINTDNDTFLILTIDSLGNATDTTASDLSISSGFVKDAVGNPLAAISAANIFDSQPPLIVSAKYYDNGTDTPGDDTIYVEFSEAVDTALIKEGGIASETFTISQGSTLSGTISKITGIDSAIIINLDANSVINEGSDTIDFIDNQIKDLNNNYGQAGGVSASILDRAGPILKYVYYSYGNPSLTNDDVIRFYFNENIADSGLGEDSFNFTFDRSTLGTISDTTVFANYFQITLGSDRTYLNWNAAIDSVSVAATGLIFDNYGNPSISVDTVVIADSSKPYINTSANTTCALINGNIVELIFNEEMDTANMTAAMFEINTGGGYFPCNSINKLSSTTVRLTLDAGSIEDNDYIKIVSNSVIDVNNNISNDIGNALTINDIVQPYIESIKSSFGLESGDTVEIIFSEPMDSAYIATLDTEAYDTHLKLYGSDGDADTWGISDTSWNSDFTVLKIVLNGLGEIAYGDTILCSAFIKDKSQNNAIDTTLSLDTGITDDSVPIPSITYPATDSHDTNYGVIRISGTVSDTSTGYTDSIALFINNVLQYDTIVCSGGYWSGTVTLNTSTRANTVTVFVIDPWANDTSAASIDTVLINFFDAPVPEISYPSYTTHDTTSNIITINGTTLNTHAADTIVIYTNYSANTTVVLTAVDGSFSGTAILTNIYDSIVVCINDTYGRQVYDTIIVSYFDTPTAEITYPDTDTHDTNEIEITISGTTINTHAGDTVHIFVDNVLNCSATLSGLNGTFTGTCLLNSYNDSIVIQVNDLYGRQYYDTLNVNYFASPTSEITYPDTDSHDTKAIVITIMGTTINTHSGDTVVIYTNYTANTTVVLTALDGSFSGTALLNGYDDSVVIEVNDLYGRQYYDTIEINYFDLPTAEITYPDAVSHDTSSVIVLITGTTVNTHTGDTVVIYTDGNANTTVVLANVDGAFSGTAFLNGQGDSVMIEVNDMYGRQYFDTITVNYFSSPLAEITYPDSDSAHDTNEIIISIIGTTYNTHPGDTVVIYTNNAANTTFVCTGTNGMFSGTALLSGYNDSVLIQVNDVYGRQYYDTLHVNYFGNPTAEIIYPDTTSHDTKIQLITISGTTINTHAADTVVVYTNNTANTTVVLTALDGSFSGTALLSGFDDSVVIEINDMYGRQYYDTIIVSYYNSPTAEITYPDTIYAYDTITSVITVSGTSYSIHAGDTIVVMTDYTANTTVVVSAFNGAWSGTAALNGWGDSIVIQVNDQYGRTYYDSLTVNYFGIPSISNFVPGDNHDTTASLLVISGSVNYISAADTIEIFSYCGSIPDTTVTLQNVSGTYADWSGTVHLSGVGDSILFKIHDSFGRINYDTKTLNYFDTPAIYIASPDSGFDTMYNYLLVSGTGIHLDEAYGDTVTIYGYGALMATDVVAGLDTVSWSGSISLTTQDDTVLVELVDRWGRASYDTIFVGYFQYPAMDITNPPDTAIDTYVTSINFSGTTSNYKKAATPNNIIYSSLNQAGFAITSGQINSDNGNWSVSNLDISGCSLNAVNSLTLRVYDTAAFGGRVLYDTLTINYLGNLYINIDTPADHYDTTADTITLQGTFASGMENDTITIFVNSFSDTQYWCTAAANFTGTWSGTAYVSGVGDSVIVQFQDQFGRLTYDTITVNHMNSPGIWITSPANSTDTDEQYVRVSGTTTECRAGDTVVIYTNNGMDTYSIITLTEDSGTWEGTTNVDILSETIIVKLYDRFNRNAMDSITIDYLGTPGVWITSPATSADTNENVIWVRGTSAEVRANDTVEVFVNGGLTSCTVVVLTADSDVWEGTAYVDVLIETVSVQLTDQFNRVTADTITVDYLGTPGVWITAPPDGEDTDINIIALRGTTAECRAGDTVNIYTNNGTTSSSSYVITYDSGTWWGTAYVDVLFETVSVSLTDQFGRVTGDTITVEYLASPGVWITAPGDGEDTDINIITLRGTTAECRAGDIVNIYTNNGTTSCSSYVITSDSGTWWGTAYVDILFETVSVSLTDQFGRITGDTITMQYLGTPGVWITYPEDGHDTNQNVITIKGTTAEVRAGDTVELFVDNGVTSCTITVLTGDSGTWEGTVFTNVLGETVSVQLNDQFGRVAADTITIDYLATPGIWITAPVTGEDTNINIISLRGTTAESRAGDTVQIYANDGITLCSSYILIADSGTWWGTAYVDILAETVSVTLTDQFGRVAADTITIDYLGTPGIWITSPPTNEDTSTNIVVLRGTTAEVRAGDTVEIFVNGGTSSCTITTLTADSGTWSGTAYVDIISETVSVQLNDQFGRVTADTINLNYLAAPAIWITAPVTGEDTKYSIVTLRGTTSNSRIGDTVQIYTDIGTTFCSSYIITGDSDNWWGTALVDILAETVTVTLTDQFGRSAYDTIEIDFIDTPSIGIDTPADNTDTNETIIYLSGTTADCRTGDTVKIYVDNGTSLCTSVVVTSDSGSWSGTAYLNVAGVFGETVSASITDQFGRVTGDTIVVNYIGNPGVWISPSLDGRDTDEQVIQLRGITINTRPGDYVKIFVDNGASLIDSYTISVDSGSWSGTAYVDEQAESVTVYLYDQFSRLKWDTETVNYWAAPELSFTYPEDTDVYDTFASSITVGGTVASFQLRLPVGLDQYAEYSMNGGAFTLFSTPVSGDNGNWSKSNLTGWIKDTSNILVVRAHDTFTRYCYDTMTINYVPNLNVTITAPVDNHDTITDPILIRGTYSSAMSNDTITITVNNGGTACTTIVAVDNFTGSWSGTAALSGTGDSVQLAIHDQFGRVSYDTITVNYMAPPTIEITYPDTLSYDTLTQLIAIRGTTSNSSTGDTVVVYTNSTVNTTSVIIGVNGDFTGTALLTNQCDSIIVQINDQFGRQSYDTLTVNYFPTPIPEISYPSYTSHDTSDAVITISGSTDNTQNGDTVVIYTNYAPNTTVILVGMNAGFSGTAAVSGQNDTIVIEINDQFGRQVYDTITVNYFLSPTIGITYPDAITHDTLTQEITVRGTTYNTQINDTVTIYTNTTANTNVVLSAINGTFSGTALLSDQKDSIIVMITDQFGRNSYETIVVNYFPLPVPEISYPAYVTDDTYVQIISIGGSTDNTQNGDTVVIYTNYTANTTVVLAGLNGTFSGTALLSGQKDTITIEVNDQFGRQVYDTLVINYFDAISMDITYPSYTTHDTTEQVITISGTTYNVNTYDTVMIYTNYTANTSVVLSAINGTYSGTAKLTDQSDSIIVRLMDQFGRNLYDTITVNYFPAPTGEITYPDTVIHDTNQQIITISGTTDNTQNGDSVIIYTNGTANTSVLLVGLNSTFSGTARLTGQQDSVVIEIRDQFGRSVYDTITLNYFDTVYVEISYPSYTTHDTNEQVITISGTTRNTMSGDTVVIYSNNTLNTSVVLAGLNGSFSGTASLSGQNDSIVICVMDQFNRNTYDTISVNYFPAVAIEISYPSYITHDTDEQIIYIQGTTNNTNSGDTVIIYTNYAANTSVVLTGLNGSYSGTALLTDQQDSIIVSIVDQFNRSVYDTITVNYFPTPVPEISYPGYVTHDTNYQLITVAGTTDNTQNGDTVTIYTNTTVNTSVVLVGMNAAFSGTAFISNMKDSIVIKIQDQFGRTVYDTITVNFMDTPVVELSYPAYASHDTNVQNIIVRGTTLNTQNLDTVVIYINNVENTTIILSGLNGSFSGTASLTFQSDSLVAKVIDQFGRASYDTAVMNYWDTPVLYMTYPTDSDVFDTYSSSIMVGGTTANYKLPSSAGKKLVKYSINSTTYGTSFDNFTDGDNGSCSQTNITGFTADSTNIIYFRSEDLFGRYAYDSFSIRYPGSLSVEIDTPINNVDTTIQVITIQGTYSSALANDTITLYVDNYGIASSTTTVSTDYAGTWSGTVLLNGTGDSVIMKLTDRWGRTAYDTITVNFMDSPVVEISYPGYISHDTNVNLITISGTTKNSSAGDTVVIYTRSNANTTVVLTGVNGDFSGTALISQLWDSIVVEINDQFGRRLYDTIQLNYFDSPTAEITYPDTLSHDTGFTSITISGTTVNTHPGDTVVIFTNTNANTTIVLTDINGTFSGTAAITGYYDSIAIYVYDTYGRTTFDTITVNYLDTPVVVITYPTSTSIDTMYNLITIAGTTAHTRSGDTVTLYSDNAACTSIRITELDGSFSGTVLLNSYNDSIVAVITDAFARTNYDTVNVNYFDTPTAECTYPIASGYHDTIVQEIYITGTTVNTHPGDTVVIYTDNTANTTVVLTDTDGVFTGTALLNGLGDSIMIGVNDIYGRVSYDTITVNYYIPPTLELTYPSDKHDTNIQVITISGTVNSVRNSDSVAIYLISQTISDSVPVTGVTNGTAAWTGTACLVSIGDSVVAKVIDAWGRVSYDTVTVNYYGEPELNITYPADTLVYDTLTQVIRIEGTTKNTAIGDTVYLYVNTYGTEHSDSVLVVDSDSWNGTVLLNGWGDSIIVKLKDRFGGFTYDTITVNYYIAPTLEITSPATSADTKMNVISISGTANNVRTDDSITIYIGGSAVSDTIAMVNMINGTDTTWTGTVLLTGIGDSLVAELMDRWGRIVYDTIMVDYFDSPTAGITYPDSITYDTMTNIITVSGTTVNTHEGDTVLIYTDNVANATVALTSINGTFSGTALLNSYNDSIMICINDVYGRQYYDTINVNYFDTPTTEITYPDSVGIHDTMEQLITIMGTTVNTRAGDTVSIYVDNVFNTSVVLTSTDGTFSGTALLNGIGDSISVKVQDAYSRISYDTVTVNYYTGPTVELTYPSDNTDTNIGEISVRGTVNSIRNNDTIIIYLSGAVTSDTIILSGVANGTAAWNGTVVLSGMGDSLIVKLSDQWGRSNYDTITVNFFGEPVVNISYPADITTHDTLTQVITVRGTTGFTTTGDSINLYVDNMTTSHSDTVLQSDSGEWQGTVLLNGWGDSIIVRVKDRFGGYKYDTITVNYYAAPTIEITLPVNSADTKMNVISISGTVNNVRTDDSITIYIAGQTVSDTVEMINMINGADTTWKGTVLLTGIADSLVVKVTDRFSRATYDTIMVDYFDSATAEITYPTSTIMDTATQQVTIMGTTVNTHENDTVAIYVNNTLSSVVTLGSINDTYSGTAQLTGLGCSVVICVNDTYGRQYYDTINISYFGNPTANITYPDTLTYDTKAIVITVSGTTDNTHEGDTVVIYTDNTVMNATIVLTSIDGSFSGTALLNGLSDSISICVNDTYGRVTYDTITVNYYDTPTIEITTPDDNSGTNVRVAGIHGTVANVGNSDTIEMWINGYVMSDTVILSTVTNGIQVWSGTVLLHGTGDSVYVKITDRWNRTDYDSITVNLSASFENPNVEICTPAYVRHDTSSQVIYIGGTTVNSPNGDTIQLFVNNLTTVHSLTNLTADSGSWSGTVKLSGIGDSVVVRFTDRFGQIRYDTILVNYLDTPGIEITYPAVSSHDTNVQSIIISGTTVNSLLYDTVQIYVDNTLNTTIIINSSNGTFSGTALLNGRGDSIYARFTDQFGRNAHDTITVEYYGGPDINITSPVNNYDTTSAAITLYGTTIRTDAGDSVGIYLGTILQGTTTLSTDLSWSATSSLSGQGDTVYAYIIDSFGQIGSGSIVVNYFIAPTINITGPVSDTSIDTIAASISFSGTTANYKNADTYVLYRWGSSGGWNNFYQMTADNSSWSDPLVAKSIPTANAANIFNISVTDTFGRTAYDSIIINYLPSLGLEITSPSNDTKLASQSISVAGTFVSAMPNDTVYIYVNNTLHSSDVLGSTDQFTGNWSGTANITAVNQSLTVKIQDKFARTYYDTITVSYYTTPDIEITSPADATETTSYRIIVTGTTASTYTGDSIIVYLDGTASSTYALTADNGSWTDTVTLTSDSTMIAVKLIDQLNRSYWDTVNVAYNSNAGIGITTPSTTGFDTYSTTLRVSGTTVNSFPGDTIEISVNGTVQQTIIVTDTNTSWDSTISISDLGNTVTITLKPQTTASISDSFVVYYLGVPTLEITYPQNNIDTYNSSIVVRGTTNNVKGSASVLVYVDNQVEDTVSLNSYNQSWSATVDLNGLSDKITAVLTDEFGRNYYDTITVDYFTVLGIDLTTPVDNYYTADNVINVSGSSTGSDRYNEVKIYTNGSEQSSYVLGGAGGSWSGTAAVSNSSSTVSVIITDALNRTASDSITVYFKNQVFVSITSPSVDYLDTNVKQHTISGTSAYTNQGDTINVYMNNLLYAATTVDASGNWSSAVSLTYAGASEDITVKLSDRYGNTAYDTLSITYTRPQLESISYNANSGTLTIICDKIMNYTGIDTANMSISSPGLILDISLSGAEIISDTPGRKIELLLKSANDIQALKESYYINGARIYYISLPAGALTAVNLYNSSINAVSDSQINFIYSTTIETGAVNVDSGTMTLTFTRKLGNLSTYGNSIEIYSGIDKVIDLAGDTFVNYPDTVYKFTLTSLQHESLLAADLTDITIKTSYGYLMDKDSNYVIAGTVSKPNVIKTVLPVITLTFPADTTYLSAVSTIRVQGSVTDADSLILIAPGQTETITLDADSSFSQLVTISALTDLTDVDTTIEIKLKAINVSGTYKYKVFYFHYDSIKPVLNVTSPAPGSLTLNYGETLVVSGTITDNVKLSVNNGYRLYKPPTRKSDFMTVANDSFYMTFPNLQRGLNQFTLLFYDKAGNNLTYNFGVNVVDIIDTSVADTETEEAVVVVKKKISKDTGIVISQKNADTLTVDVPVDQDNNVDSIGVSVDFEDTGNALSIKPSESTVFDTVSDHSDVSNFEDGSIMEIDASDSVGNDVGHKLAALSFRFALKQAQWALRKTFSMMYLDEVDTSVTRPAGRWKPYAGQKFKYYPALFTVEIKIELTPHLTIVWFGKGAAPAAANLNSIQVYPNPFKPNDGNPSTGLEFSGVAGDKTGIYIKGLTANAKISIFTITGELVASGITPENAGGIAIWDGKNRDGMKVASGIYLAVIEDEIQKVVKKIAIIR